MKPVITIKNLSKKYQLGEKAPYYSFRETLENFFRSMTNSQNIQQKREIWALKDINLEVNQGEVIGIIGRNGAGKSTFLKILSQITCPTKGEVILSGRVGTLLEVGTGFHQELTGRENIFLNGAILGMTRNEIQRKYDDIVNFSEIGNFLDTPVKYYSSGMYMRLAFSIAAHLEPEILLVDEVLAVGDAEFQEKCIRKMGSISKDDKRTILFVSHNMDAIQKLCNRAILIDHGKIIKIGNTSEVVNEYLKQAESIAQKSYLRRKDRSGTGQIKVSKVFFKDSVGRSIHNFISGEDAEIWIEYERVDKKIKKIDFSIEIKSFYDQNKIAFISNSILRKEINTKNRVIKIKIDKTPLLPGKYQFSIALLGKNGEVYDWLPVANVFNINYGDFYKTRSLPEKDQGYFLLYYEIN